MVFNILYYFLVTNAAYVTLPAVLLASGVGAGRRRRAGLDPETEALAARLKDDVLRNEIRRALDAK